MKTNPAIRKWVALLLLSFLMSLLGACSAPQRAPRAQMPQHSASATKWHTAAPAQPTRRLTRDEKMAIARAEKLARKQASQKVTLVQTSKTPSARPVTRIVPRAAPPTPQAFADKGATKKPVAVKLTQAQPPQDLPYKEQPLQPDDILIIRRHLLDNSNPEWLEQAPIPGESVPEKSEPAPAPEPAPKAVEKSVQVPTPPVAPEPMPAENPAPAVAIQPATPPQTEKIETPKPSPSPVSSVPTVSLWPIRDQVMNLESRFVVTNELVVENLPLSPEPVFIGTVHIRAIAYDAENIAVRIWPKNAEAPTVFASLNKLLKGSALVDEVSALFTDSLDVKYFTYEVRVPITSVSETFILETVVSKNGIDGLTFHFQQAGVSLAQMCERIKDKSINPFFVTQAALRAARMQQLTSNVDKHPANNVSFQMESAAEVSEASSPTVFPRMSLPAATVGSIYRMAIICAVAAAIFLLGFLRFRPHESATTNTGHRHSVASFDEDENADHGRIQRPVMEPLVHEVARNFVQPVAPPSTPVGTPVTGAAFRSLLPPPGSTPKAIPPNTSPSPSAPASAVKPPSQSELPPEPPPSKPPLPPATPSGGSSSGDAFKQMMSAAAHVPKPHLNQDGHPSEPPEPEGGG